MFEHFAGIRVFTTEAATKRVAVKRSKNTRQQKKFIKKFGYTYTPAVIQTPAGLFVHPEILVKIKEITNK